MAGRERPAVPAGTPAASVGERRATARPRPASGPVAKRATTRAPARRRFGIEATARAPGPAMGERAARTRELILDTARELFLSLGYGGTTIDRIAKAAGISRASVYTYYPTKRDVLLASGETTFSDGEAVIARLDDLATPARPAELEAWARQYLDFLERNGAFIMVLGQAATDDPELRRVGTREYRRTARRLAAGLTRLRSAARGEVSMDQAVAVLAMMERMAMWRSDNLQLVDDAAATVARLIHAVLRAG